MDSQQELLCELIQIVICDRIENSVDGYKHRILFQLYFAMFFNLNAMPRPNSALVHSAYAHFKAPCPVLNPGVLLLIYSIWTFLF